MLLLLAVLVQQLAQLHHAVQLVRRVAQQRLQVTHEPVHVPAKIFTYRQKYLDLEKNIDIDLDWKICCILLRWICMQ